MKAEILLRQTMGKVVGNMSTCKVYGYIVNSKNEAKEGALVQFIPASIPSVNSSTGKAICAFPVECTTSSTGYFEADLIINTDFMAIIFSIGLKEKIRVPDEVTKNLFSLVGMYESGDPTPQDEDGW